MLVCKYRQLFQGTLIESRSTYLNDVDQLAAIQLSVLFLQKDGNGVAEATSPQHLFQLQKKIYNKKVKSVDEGESVVQEEDGDTDGLLTFSEMYESYVSFTKHCNMIDNADVKRFVLDSESQGENKENDDGLKERSMDDIFSSPPPALPQATPVRSTPASSTKSPSWKTPLRSRAATFSPFPSSPKDPSNVQLRRVIISYLQLIVNSRNEIALARVIDLPTRGIDRKSFTAIRKLSVEKGMPMYQVISSYVRQCILGGKGYAPSDEHSLFHHKGGLMEFIDLMDKLQTIVDEGTTIHSVLTTLFKALKVAFVRVKVPVFSAKTVSVVVQELLSVANSKFSDGSVKHGDLVLLLRDYIDVVSCLAGNEVSMHSTQLCGILSTPEVSTTTYRKINTLLSNFQTPQPADETPKKIKDDATEDEVTGDPQMVNEGTHATTPLLPKANILADIEEEEEESENKEQLLNPVKLIRCPSVSSVEEKEHTTNQMKAKVDIFTKVKTKKIEKAATKTAVGASEPIAPPAAKRKPAAPAKPKAKCAKKIKLVSGQKTLSQFFKK